MAHNSTRLGLNEPDGTDPVTNFPAVDQQAMGILDNAELYNEGTMSNEPIAANVEHGRVYHTTDTHQWFMDDGTTWWPIMIPAPWQNLTLSAGVSTVVSDWSTQARIIGDKVELSGTIQNTSGGSIAVGATLFTLPNSLMNPQKAASLNVTLAAGGTSLAAVLTVGTGGAVSLSSTGPAWPSNYILPLNNLSFRTS